MTQDQAPSLSPQVLGQLLLMQSVVWGLPDTRTIFSFICKGLKQIPGVHEVRYTSSMEQASDSTIINFPLKLAAVNYGTLYFRVFDTRSFAPYTEYLQNFCVMVTVILEQHKRMTLDELHTSRLEQHVVARTKALSESEKKWRAVFERSPVGIIMTDGQGVVIDCNQQFTDLFGAQREKYFGLKLLEVMPAGPVRKNLEDALAFAGIHHYTGPYTSVISGKAIYINITSERITSDLLIAIIIDMTEQRESALAQEKLQAHLLQAQKMETIGRLAGGVAHDFNNMLGVILGHAEMALDHPEQKDHPIREDLLEIQKAAMRSADLTRQLLAFARKQTVSPKRLDLNDKIEGLLKMLRRLIGEDIDLVWKPGKRLWPVKIDPSQIDQILANLCLNARDAITGLGKITLETENVQVDEGIYQDHLEAYTGPYVMMSIADTGCGMDQQTQAHIFEPFFTTKEVGQGTGLGLATIYGIVRQNGGFLQVSSSIGQGSTFRIYLPMCADLASGDQPAHAPQQGGHGLESILLVEDEPAILFISCRMLESLGYHVLTARSPHDALKIAREYGEKIDMLLTDVVMPEMNGRDLAANLKKLYPSLQCLFMSGYTADIIAQHGLLAEGVQFIEKPFTRREISEKVRKILDGVRSTSEQTSSS